MSYPSIPHLVALHYGVEGVPNRILPKSVGAAFSLRPGSIVPPFRTCGEAGTTLQIAPAYASTAMAVLARRANRWPISRADSDTR